MREEIDKFRAIWSEKTEAKQRALAAVGRALLAESKGEDAHDDWQVVAIEGITHGVEGQKMAEAQECADRLVLEHPEFFAAFAGRDRDTIVDLISAFRVAGLEDDATLGTIYELAHFERVDVTAALKAKARIPNLGGKK